MTSQTPQSASRLDRILAYLVAGVMGLSILAFVAVIIGTATGAGASGGFGRGVWPIVLTLPLFGLPLGFLIIIALLVITGVRRSREARQGRQ